MAVHRHLRRRCSSAQPLYGALVARLPRARFIPIVYHFFVANLALFWLLLTLGIAPVTVARVFFVWVSVFNLFAVAVFWSFMADLFTSEQGKRLFGFIGAGGTAGALLGPVITIALSVPLGPANLLIAALALLELAVLCVHRLERAATASGSGARAATTPQRVGGSAFAALPELLRSPYLLGVGAWVSLLSFGATIALFRAGEHRRGDGARRRRADAHLRRHRSRGGPAHPGDAGVRHRPTARALRHRRRRRRAAGWMPCSPAVASSQSKALFSSLVICVRLASGARV